MPDDAILNIKKKYFYVYDCFVSMYIYIYIYMHTSMLVGQRSEEGIRFSGTTIIDLCGAQRVLRIELGTFGNTASALNTKPSHFYKSFFLKIYLCI
jgi:hypothetical protein